MNLGAKIKDWVCLIISGDLEERGCFFAFSWLPVFLGLWLSPPSLQSLLLSVHQLLPLLGQYIRHTQVPIKISPFQDP
jgi:hypothetical protein